MTSEGSQRKRPVFPAAPKEEPPVAETPETLFGELPRTREGAGALWSHQSDQLRDYFPHRNAPDVALELPTGSGKTLVGLLAGEWRRRALHERVVYACPTVQLARQVARAAEGQGIPARLLTGTSKKWNPGDLSLYTRGEAIAVTTYSHIFNTNPKLSDAKTLIFDDAHAAEGYVADAWAVKIDRKKDPSAYLHLFDALGDEIDQHLVRRMVGSGEDVASDAEVRMLPLALTTSRLTNLDAVLDAELLYPDDQYYRFQMIRSSLESCLFYVSRSGWYIRPMIPPTFNHPAFTEPRHRIYLSATLGDAGELERAFGRSPITRVPVPPAWDKTGSGRRFFVFSDLVEDDSAEEAVQIEVAPAATAGDGEASEGADAVEPPTALQKLTALSPKRLILTPAEKLAKQIADDLNVPALERFTAGDDSGEVEKFLDADIGTLIAPNRYDGMDLAGAKCRVVVMSGIPSASHLQDRFLESKLRAGTVLAERIRTRIIQGAGRCTRGVKDWAVIVVTGEELLRYFSDREHTKPMRIELQAEIEFGLRASSSSLENVIGLTESALEQDEVWREDAEPALTEGRRLANREPAPVAAELAASAPREVAAWKEAWRADWDAAGKAAVRVLEGLTGEETRPYRALWAYLASAWFAKSARYGEPSAEKRAADLLHTAHKAAAGTVWLREIQTLSSWQPLDEPADEDAIARIVERINGAMKSSTKCEARFQDMLAALADPEATAYEQGLVNLGEFLGATSWKPKGQGRADAAWVWPELWMTVEAKSEQTAVRLSMEYVRKANTQLDSLAGDLEQEIPEQSIGVIVPQNRIVDPDAVPIARDHLYLAATDVILGLAHDVHRAWNEMRGSVLGLELIDARDTVAKTLWEHNVLPSQVRDRLTHKPVRGA